MKQVELEYGKRRVRFLVPLGNGTSAAFHSLVCDEYDLPLDARLGLETEDGAVMAFSAADVEDGGAYRLRVYRARAADELARSRSAADADAADMGAGANASAGPGPGGEDADLVGQLMRTELRPNHVVALYAHAARSAVEMTFAPGDLIRVLGQYSEGWWKGELVRYGGDDDDAEPRIEGVGYFPANFVHGLERIQVESGGDVAAAAAGADGTDGADPMQDQEYFDSYATLVIHHQMLADRPRTLAYMRAVEALSPLVRGKTVMDVGCGSGVLSLFCARAGAKHVYAVDASDIIHLAAAKTVEANGYADRVTLIKGKVEHIELPVPQVDVIISEWMGTYLVCESMIESVLLARERFLAPGGVMMPSDSTLFLAPLCLDELYEEVIGFWDDVYGFDMSCLAPQAKATFLSRPSYDRLIKEEELIGDGVPVWRLDMGAAVAADLEEHTSDFELEIARDGRMHGFGAWFDVSFAGPGCETTVLSTSPRSPGTHWKQVMFKLSEPVEVARGQRVRGTITVRRNPTWRRHFETSVTFAARDGDEPTRLDFEMWR